jgi:hypothetical protein
LGNGAGGSNTTGSYNTIIGHCANVSANNLSNVIAIGTCVVATASNQLAMGSTTWPLSTTSTAGAAEGFLVINLNGTLRKIQFNAV